MSLARFPRPAERKADNKHLAATIRNTMGKYELPEDRPCVIEGLTQWAATTPYSSLGSYRAVNAAIYTLIKTGTSGSTAPSGKGFYITDGTCIWSYFGQIAPVAFANNLTLLLGQIFVANSMLFKVTVAGTLHASDAAPTTEAAGTHGTVSYVYIGPQTLPIVSLDAAASGGVTSQAAWDSSKLTIRGGTVVQDGANPRAGICSVSADGSTSPLGGGAGGSVCYANDAPDCSFVFINNDGGSQHWVDGKFLAFTYRTATSACYMRINASGLPRRLRNYRHKINSSVRFYGVYALGTDTIKAWAGFSTVDVVAITDSFGENLMGYTGILGDLMGLEGMVVTGLGSTGVLDVDTNRVNYGGRFTVDVINRAPDVVAIQLTQNDTTQTASAVAAALEALIDRVHSETSAICIVIGVWNNRAPLTSGTAFDINAACATSCTNKNVQFIDWKDLLTDGGYVGSASGTGTSLYLTGSDTTHPTPVGHRVRADYVAPRFLDAIEAVAA